MIVSSPDGCRHLLQCDGCGDMTRTAQTRPAAVAIGEAAGWVFRQVGGWRCRPCQNPPVKAAA